MPEPTAVEKARVDAEVRALADDVSDGLTKPWVSSIRTAAASGLPDLAGRLDRALAGTDLGVGRLPWWAGLVRVVQWLLILAALGGAGWLAVLAVLSYLQMDSPEPPEVGSMPVPTLMLIGGVVLGVLFALVCRVLVRATARRRAASAEAKLRSAIAEVAQELVIGPVEAELAAYATARDGLVRALR
jgi:hypothetical protein